MATVREGNQAALLVVDLQVGVVKEAWNADRIIRNVARLVDRARNDGVPVLWVQHSDQGLIYGSPEWEWVPDLVPREAETRIHKHFESSFEETTLEAELAKVGATHVVLAGASTNWCIRATAYAALDRGYDLTLISDAHTTRSIELEGEPKIEAASLITDLNLAMTWLSYPGRRNGATETEKVDFSVVDDAKLS